MEPAKWRVAIITVVPGIAEAYTEAIRAVGHNPVVVISPRRRRSGDRLIPLNGPLAEETPEGLDVLLVETRAAMARLLRAYDVDLGLCTGLPWLLPSEVIEAPRLGIVNGHPSLLPRYRGPFPIAWAVRNGENEIGITYHLMDASFDTGNVLAQSSVPLDDDDTWDTVQRKTAVAGLALLPTVFERLARGERGEPQEGEGEYQSVFEDAYFFVDPARAALDIHRQVRAWGFVPPVMPQLGPLLERGDGYVRVTRSSLTDVDGAERLDCSDGPLWIVETEPARLPEPIR